MADNEIQLGESKLIARENGEAAKMRELIEESDVKSDFYMVMETTLESATAKRLYKRVFEHAQTQATAAILLTRKFGLRELSDTNVTKIDDALSQLSSLMQQDIVYADKILEDTGVKKAATTEDSVTLDVKITCPQGMQVLNLIRQLDMLSTKLKTLWMAGELSLANSEDRAHGWQRRIFKSCDAIRALGQQAYIAAEQKKQSDAEKIKKQATRQQDRRQSRSGDNKPTSTPKKAVSEKGENSKATSKVVVSATESLTFSPT